MHKYKQNDYFLKKTKRVLPYSVYVAERIIQYGREIFKVQNSMLHSVPKLSHTNILMGRIKYDRLAVFVVWYLKNKRFWVLSAWTMCQQNN